MAKLTDEQITEQLIQSAARRAKDAEIAALKTITQETTQ